MIIDQRYKFKRAPRYLACEGVNGAGKSTLIKAISSFLIEQGQKVHETREPGGSRLGKELRPILLGKDEAQVSPLAELLLFGADRAQHVAEVVRPALSKGETVLSDRCYHSTIAFQGHGRGLDRLLVSDINRIATDGVLPELVILLDLDPQIGLARINHGRAAQHHEKDSFEKEKMDFQVRVREGFLAVAKSCHEPVLVLDASLSPDKLLEQVTTLLSNNGGR